MKRQPPHAPTTTIRPRAAQPPVSRLGRWARRRRRAAADHLLRGVCYGIGTGAAGLAFWWMEQHL